MTNFTTRMTMAAATLVAAAGAASAQTMRAEIPFPFRANRKVMTPGDYSVTLNQTGTGVPVLYFLNSEGNRGAMVPVASRNDPPKAWRLAGNPVLSFQCGAQFCTLGGVWSGGQAPAYHVVAPKADRTEPSHVALVVMRTGNSD